MRWRGIDTWDIEQLLAPARCLICAAPSVEICSSCSPRSTPNVAKVPGIEIPLLYSFIYSEEFTRIVLAAKEDHVRVAQYLLSRAYAELFHYAHNTLQRNSYLVLLVPSSPHSLRKRGYVHLHRTLRFLPGLCTFPVRVIDVLVSSQSVRDQTELTPAERDENVTDRFRLRTWGSGDRMIQMKNTGRAGIILLDDVVSTGSSMRESIRALKRGGIEPDMLISACISERLVSHRIGP